MEHPETDPQRMVARISASKSKAEILGVLAEGLTAVLDASGTAVLLADAPNRVLHGFLGWPVSSWPGFEKVRVSLDEDVAVSLAYETGKPIIITDAEKDMPTKKWVVRTYKCLSIMFVPIIGDKPIGCIAVSESRRLRHFTDDEVKIACDLTEMGARAIDRLEPDSEAKK